MNEDYPNIKTMLKRIQKTIEIERNHLETGLKEYQLLKASLASSLFGNTELIFGTAENTIKITEDNSVTNEGQVARPSHSNNGTVIGHLETIDRYLSEIGEINRKFERLHSELEKIFITFKAEPDDSNKGSV